MNTTRYLKVGLTVVFGLLAFWFWRFSYPAHLAYQEQFQLFLWDAEYWWERVVVPGGVAEYVAEFLTQFYVSLEAAAVIVSLLLVALQQGVWWMARRLGASSNYYPLSFIPSLLWWHFMGDENAMLALGISLLMACVSVVGYLGIRHRKNRMICVLGMVPVLYWLAGPAHFVWIAMVMAIEIRRSWAERNYWLGFTEAGATLLWGILCPMICSYFLQYPLARLMTGIGYYRFPIGMPTEVGFLLGALAFLPLVMAGLPTVRKPWWGTILQLLVLGIGGIYWVIDGCDWDKEEALEYDRLVRHKQWNAIVQKAREKSPTAPFSVTCLNLALGKTGQMGDRMFEFYQNGTEGLLPEFQRDFTSPLPTGEAFYYLGMVNTAQRYMFEAMEAIPNFRKSGRCFKRLAETNLINGQYEVAAKYLRALQKTLFYKDWADETMTYLYQEDKINAHPEWGWLRQVRYTEDFLFSNREVDVMLGLLYQQNHQNRLAFEYMLAYVLQNRDLEKFMKYYPLGKYAGYDHIPRSYQEALIFVWTQTHQDFKKLPWSISPQVLRAVSEFASVYATQPNALQLLHARYWDTYWYYLLRK